MVGASSNETGNSSGGTAQAAAAAVPISGLEFAVRHLLATRQVRDKERGKREVETERDRDGDGDIETETEVDSEEVFYTNSHFSLMISRRDVL